MFKKKPQNRLSKTPLRDSDHMLTRVCKGRCGVTDFAATAGRIRTMHQLGAGLAVTPSGQPDMGALWGTGRLLEFCCPGCFEESMEMEVRPPAGRGAEMALS